MIRIQKPAAPAILGGNNNSGPKETEKLKTAFVAGERQFKFKSTIYGAKSVKNALLKAQHQKCCFCESQFAHVAYGDVEHFRPKGGWIQATGDPLTQPGYYWLAYDWTNLFASCQICNQQFKKNHFPLIDPATRASSHLDDVSQEAHLLPHLSDDDPELFITYDSNGNPVAINDAPRGRAMIEIYGLDRSSLVDRRREILDSLAQLKEAYLLFKIRQDDGSITSAETVLMEKIRQKLIEMTEQTSEYSVLKKAFLGSFA